MPIFKRYVKRSAITVKNVMSSPAVTTTKNTTINDVAKLMWNKKVGCVIVTDERGKAVGLITERDILYSAANRLFEKNLPAEKIMSKNVVSTTPDASILEAIEKMRSVNVRHLPVMSPNGTPEGMVSLRDVLDIAFQFISVLQPPD